MYSSHSFIIHLQFTFFLLQARWRKILFSSLIAPPFFFHLSKCTLLRDEWKRPKEKKSHLSLCLKRNSSEALYGKWRLKLKCKTKRMHSLSDGKDDDLTEEPRCPTHPFPIPFFFSFSLLFHFFLVLFFLLLFMLRGSR